MTIHRIVFSILLLPAGAGALRGAESRSAVAPDLEAVRRVVAIGDVHGDYRSFVRLLRASGLVNERLAWSGEKAVLVQTGDLLDRGADSRKVMDLLMRLEGEAARAGGRVVVLLGNHEVMNLTGDLYYLHAQELLPYAVEEDPRERKRRIDDLRGFLRGEKPLLGSDYYGELHRTLERSGYESKFPPGYFRHRELFSPEGRYGKWLLSHHALFKVDRSVFLHGGLSPRFGRTSFRELRRRFREDLREYFRIVQELADLGVFHPLLGSDVLLELVREERATGRIHPMLGPLFRRLAALLEGPVFAADGLIWYRGLAELSPTRLVPLVGRVLRAQDADRIVIGHTRAREQRVLSRAGGRVLLIDTGMNQEAYGGHPEALQILDGARVLVIPLKR